MIINKNLPEKFREEAVRLFLYSFWDKFGGTLKNKEKAKNLIKNSMKLENIIYVEEQGELLGFVTINSYREGACIEPKFEEIKKIYSVVESFIVYLKLLLFRHKSSEGEIYIEFIAVSEKARGMGLGTRLMDELLGYAKKNYYKKLTLLVVENNPKAKILYEKLGFCETGVWKTWWFKRVLKIGYDKIFAMEKKFD